MKYKSHFTHDTIEFKNIKAPQRNVTMTKSSSLNKQKRNYHISV